MLKEKLKKNNIVPKNYHGAKIVLAVGMIKKERNISTRYLAVLSYMKYEKLRSLELISCLIIHN